MSYATRSPLSLFLLDNRTEYYKGFVQLCYLQRGVESTPVEFLHETFTSPSYWLYIQETTLTYQICVIIVFLRFFPKGKYQIKALFLINFLNELSQKWFLIRSNRYHLVPCKENFSEKSL